MIATSQRTINSKVSCSGIGLHSGAKVNMSLLPAPAGSGIVFKRIDIAGGPNNTDNIIIANYQNVTGTNLGTVLTGHNNVSISTIEHLMAAIHGLGIDSLIVEIDGPELPIMDGSSEPFVFLIECAGISVQEEQRKMIEIVKEVHFGDQNKFINVKPAKDFIIDIEIGFNHKHADKQQYSFHSAHNSFKNDLCRARTFAFEKEIEMMLSLGLAKGGSLDNAIVIGENGVINPEGLRYKDELVRHKTLDFIGDIYLAGAYILGHFTVLKPGHDINNKFLHQLFSDDSNWKLV